MRRVILASPAKPDRSRSSHDSSILNTLCGGSIMTHAMESNSIPNEQPSRPDSDERQAARKAHGARAGWSVVNDPLDYHLFTCKVVRFFQGKTFICCCPVPLPVDRQLSKARTRCRRARAADAQFCFQLSLDIDYYSNSKSMMQRATLHDNVSHH